MPIRGALMDDADTYTSIKGPGGSWFLANCVFVKQCSQRALLIQQNRMHIRNNG